MEVEQVIAQRWSPRAYTQDGFSDAQLRKVFEAGIAAHSCFNEQPWRYLFAKKNSGAPRTALENLLAAENEFAKEPWILGIGFTKKTFALNGTANRHAGHDLGSASQLMSLRAFDLGLGMRFMAGFDAEAARKLAPDDFEPYAMFTLGHVAKGTPRPPRSRKPFETFFFQNSWGNGVR